MAEAGLQAETHRGTMGIANLTGNRAKSLAFAGGLAILAGGGTAFGIDAKLALLAAQPLESRFATASLDDGEAFDGIIALGGDFRRFAAAMELAKRLPRAKLLLSAGGEEKRVAAAARDLGLPADGLILETRSANTFENAIFAARILRPRPRQRWLLVTSAAHMPRAVGVFRKAGFEVAAWPVQRAPGEPASDMLESARHEWIGLAVYWLRGRTDELFPAPAGARAAFAAAGANP